MRIWVSSIEKQGKLVVSKAQNQVKKKVSIAPMMDWTDRHFRYFFRILSRECVLYTEMVVAKTIHHARIRGNLDHYIGYNPEEQPVVIQLGGSDPNLLSEAAKVCEDYGYAGINLNVGCPSDRVQSGSFGVCLMRDPRLVGECMKAMAGATSLPLSVKCRIGVDEEEGLEFTRNFLRIVHDISGIDHFIVHARKAWLKGLSPAQNRNIPPLRHHIVYELKKEFPHFFLEINGGIKDPSQVREHLEHVDGVMIGRAAYEDPFIFHKLDTEIFQKEENPVSSRKEVLEGLVPYLDRTLKENLRPHLITRHIMGLYKGVKRAKKWRVCLNNLSKNPEFQAGDLLKTLEVFTHGSEKLIEHF